jgi:hypothetical protein
VAQAYHIALSAHVHAEREDLLLYLPDANPAGGGGGPIGALKTVTLPSVWGYDDAPSSSNAVLAADGGWTLVSALLL